MCHSTFVGHSAGFEGFFLKTWQTFCVPFFSENVSLVKADCERLPKSHMLSIALCGSLTHIEAFVHFRKITENLLEFSFSVGDVHIICEIEKVQIEKLLLW